MRGLIVRIGVTGAGGLLALGLLAGPSAANGSDQENREESKARQSNQVTCFTPEGKTQGRSMSDPDGDENGGADKPSPECTGGVNLDDRDGNNGCGNDSDREDDNNGHCQGDQASGNDTPQHQGPDNGPVQPEGDDDATVNPETVEGDVTVQVAATESESGPAGTEVSTASAATDPAAASAADDTTPGQATTPEPQTQVLGETLSAPDTPDTLARTGAGVGGLALLGGLLVGGGRLTVLARKLLRIG